MSTGIKDGNISLNSVFYVTLSPAEVAANTAAEETFTVSGLKVNDHVSVNKPTSQAGLGVVGARVSAADTLAINFGNFTSNAITPTAAENYTVLVSRPESLSSGIKS